MSKKILCILLLAVILISVLGGCKKDGPVEGSSGDTLAAPTEEDISDGLPEDLKFEKKTITVLATENQMNKTYVTDLTGTPMNDALYKRLQATKARLGVDIEFIPCAHEWTTASNYTDLVLADRLSGAVSQYDLFMTYNLLPSLMITEGYLADLTKSAYLDTSKPWWPQNMLAEGTIDDKLYYVVDNCSWGSIRNMACIVFNKELAKQYHIEESTLYNEVFNNNWTIETLENYIKNIYVDVDGQGTRDEKDIYGFATDTDPRKDAFFYSSGLRTTDRDANGNIVLTLNTAKASAVVDRYKALFSTNTSVYKTDPAIYSMFKNKKVVFYETAIAISDQNLEFDYGILPVPMWDTNQGRYITYLSNTHDAWSVPENCENLDMSGAVLTSLACEAYRYIMPQYFEEMLKDRYASDLESARVYDIIRDGVVFDF